MNRDTLYGSAQWATAAELKAAGLHKPPGLHFGFGPDGSPLWLDGDAPLFTAAGAGSGKGTTIIIPAILTYPKPLFVLDPKGENAALTIHHQARLKKDAYCINPWGIHHAAPWFLPMHNVNPLDVLAPESPSLVADCKLIMQMMIPKTSNGDDYWTLKPRELGFAVLLWQVRKEGRIDAARLYDLLSSIFARPARWKQIVEDLLAFPNVEVRRIAGEIEYKRKEAQGEFSGIMGKLFEALSFIADPALSRCLQGGDFSLSVLTDKRPVTCSRLQSSAGLRAIIGLFLLKLTDFIGPSLLTLFATMRAIMKPCLQSSGGLLTFPATERARKRRFFCLLPRTSSTS